MILLLVNVEHLVFLILEFDLKTVETTDSVLLLDQISEVHWAEAHVLKFAHLLLCDG